MAFEIERKYRVEPSAIEGVIKGLTGDKLAQGYINESGMTTRVRLVGEDKALLTLKTRADGISRREFEYEIPYEDGEFLMKECGTRVLYKTRYHVPVGNHVWDVDVYHGALTGLVTAEVELTDEAEAFEMPDWVGEDVSEDGAYTNESMARTGFIPGLPRA